MNSNKKKILKKHHKALILGIIMGIIGGGAYAATTISGTSITYSNSKSGFYSTNVQSAIDELYGKADIRKSNKFVAAYTYNSSSCVTGEESACKKTTCYKTKTSGSCPAGTIIKYKVNDTTVLNFHVMYDNGSTMTMQSQRNIVYNTAWYKDSANNANGPLTILSILESATAGWTNVNNQTYTMGTTIFNKGNAFTGCGGLFPNQCTKNTYTLASRTARARMMTTQEASALGCTTTAKTCPNWMNNYLASSTSYGGTVNDTNKANGSSSNSGYWTMIAHSSSTGYAWYINTTGRADAGNTNYVYYGARAVVVVSK